MTEIDIPLPIIGDGNQDVKNNQEDKFRRLKSLIAYNESIEDFNDIFLELFDDLPTDEKEKISVLDYENAIKIAFAEAEDLERACKIAEKAARILGETKTSQKQTYNNNNKNRKIHQKL
ncbi:hypothetical protein BCR32DRAFT_285665 [Anaeromyces robustus]|uniref:Uncharacterized protein n=1 Tax=Anaeromyces robustus TaxID=1754192 RepID=A0A1Y1WIM9_9FUNG|nr:hypothetical protein BCR32DRAFT_285665 [Anaeromyces robustus]|eukprot:ORX73430.1 hypothetical protein BCR32DRAFT_285665 [Anaeromyces robustus]